MMSQSFSHLVWLGAGAAQEPSNLLNFAQNVTLFEAREAACSSLKKTHPHDNIQVIQAVITIDGAPVEFTRFNLVEYSAVHDITGLKKLFPGVKPTHREQFKSTAISDAINALALKDNNNVLIVDIADTNLALLNALQKNNQLRYFDSIHIQSSSEPLYVEAVSVEQITQFLQEQGYMLEKTNDVDPDLPWLVFTLNPLWQQLLQIKDAGGLRINALEREIDHVKRELTTTQQALADSQRQAEQTISDQANLAKKALEELKNQLAKKNAEHEVSQKNLTATTRSAEKIQAELAERISIMDADMKKTQQQLVLLQQQLDKKISENESLCQQVSSIKSVADKEREQTQIIIKLQAELELINKHSAAHLEKRNKLEKTNRILVDTNTQLNIQQLALKHEMIKAEAQIDIIRELLLKQL